MPDGCFSLHAATMQVWLRVQFSSLHPLEPKWYFMHKNLPSFSHTHSGPLYGSAAGYALCAGHELCHCAAGDCDWFHFGLDA